MPYLYKDIEGWFTYQSLYDEMVEKYPNGTFAEVGCWFGKSGTYLLEKIEETKSNNIVVFVDTWLGGVGEPEWDLVCKHGFNHVFEKFIDNVFSVNPKDYKFFVKREFSALAAKDYTDETFSFVFIDAGHRGWQCYDDLAAWYPKVKTGGTIAGHDIDYKDVRASVDKYCNENKLSYEIRKSPEHCWVIQV